MSTAWLKSRRGYTALALLCLPGVLQAKDAQAAPASQAAALGWQSTAELGAIFTSGNTEGSSFSGKLESKQELQSWSNDYQLSAFFKEDNLKRADGTEYTEKSAERYQASLKSAYKLDKDHAELYGLASHTHDEFGAYQRYSLLSVGYGDMLYVDQHKRWEAEIGPGYYQARRADDQDERGALLRAATSFDWQFTETAAFRQKLTVEYSADNTRVQAESSISAKINGRMQMKAAFVVQSDSEVPVGKAKTDTQTSLTLVYAF